MLAREGQKARRRANVLVQRVTFFVGGNDLAALHIGEAGFQLFEGGGHQFTEQFLGGALGVHVDQRGQARLGLQVQVQHMTCAAEGAGGILFPVLGEFTDFHDDLC